MDDPNANPKSDPAAALMADADRAIAGARAALDDMAKSGPLAALANARSLAASLDRMVEDPESADRAKRLVYHVAGVLDALGVLPLAVAALVAEALADYATEPPPEG
ncbi:MAG: hypothetical protein BGO49_07155 [Planctomycetales bacterium 71-10]|nr:MAG: hypothetical protein BGO49_07155 [Planctomycetales bacterium 71-10]